MKTTLVRAAVFSLALVGFGAASFANKAMAASKAPVAKLGPCPSCGLHDTCGMD